MALKHVKFNSRYGNFELHALAQARACRVCQRRPSLLTTAILLLVEHALRCVCVCVSFVHLCVCASVFVRLRASRE